MPDKPEPWAVRSTAVNEGTVRNKKTCRGGAQAQKVQKD